jgi:DNA-binding PadR family transcriptional regulator
MSVELTNAEYAILGLLVERPCHGYDLERLIEERGMREWTELAFSSIYYILKKLLQRQLIEPRQTSARKTRKTYAPTDAGFALHGETTLRLLREPGPTYPTILLGLANWPALEPQQAMTALRARSETLKATLAHLMEKARPGPAFIDVLFDYSISQIKSELDWVERSLTKFGET